jgi:gluconolactonase
LHLKHDLKEVSFDMTITRLDPSFDRLVPGDARIEKVAGGFTFIEGPLWRPSGALWFSDVVGNVVRQWSPGGGVVELLRPGGYDGHHLPAGGFVGPNGMTAAPNGDVLLCQHGNRRIVRISRDMTVTTFLDKFQGKKLNAPNDIVFRSDGTLYFTDPPYGLPLQDDDPSKELPFNGVFKLQNGKLDVIITDLTRPNGIALSPDEKTLYVSNSDERQRIWMRYDVAADGNVSGRVPSIVGQGSGVPDARSTCRAISGRAECGARLAGRRRLGGIASSRGGG